MAANIVDDVGTMAGLSPSDDQERSGQSWYRLPMSSGPVYMNVKSEHDEDALDDAETGANSGGGYHFDRPASVSVSSVSFSPTPDWSIGQPDGSWTDEVLVCDLGPDRVAQVLHGALVLHGPPCEPLALEPVFDNDEDGDDTVATCELFQMDRVKDGCALVGAPLQVIGSGGIEVTVDEPAAFGDPVVLRIDGSNIEVSDGGSSVTPGGGSDSDSDVIDIVGNYGSMQAINKHIVVSTATDSDVRVSTTVTATGGGLQIGVYYK